MLDGCVWKAREEGIEASQSWALDVQPSEVEAHV